MASDRAKDLVVIVAEELNDVIEVVGTEADAFAAFNRLADIFDLEFEYARDED